MKYYQLPDIDSAVVEEHNWTHCFTGFRLITPTQQNVTNVPLDTTVPHLTGNNSAPGVTTVRQELGQTGGRVPGGHTVTHWGCIRRVSVSLVRQGNTVMGRG